LASATLGPPPDPIRVSIMVPYPEPKVGTSSLREDVQSEKRQRTVGAVTAYMAEVARRFGGSGHARLRLDGSTGCTSKCRAPMPLL
jgi:hypothetical protein